MAYLFHEHHLVVEGAGAVGVAALLAHKVPQPGKNVALVISGGNVALACLLVIVAAQGSD